LAQLIEGLAVTRQNSDPISCSARISPPDPLHRRGANAGRDRRAANALAGPLFSSLWFWFGSLTALTAVAAVIAMPVADSGTTERCLTTHGGWRVTVIAGIAIQEKLRCLR